MAPQKLQKVFEKGKARREKKPPLLRRGGRSGGVAPPTGGSSIDALVRVEKEFFLSQKRFMIPVETKGAPETGKQLD